MSKTSLERQADRAEQLAAQTVDERLKQSFLDAAKEYREQAKSRPAEGAIQTAHPPTWLGLGNGLPEQTRATTGF
jgi:hypothetical protein